MASLRRSPCILETLSSLAGERVQAVVMLVKLRGVSGQLERIAAAMRRKPAPPARPLPSPLRFARRRPILRLEPLDFLHRQRQDDRSGPLIGLACANAPVW
jgi:hypothetical protein